jgi:hypothetical protein
MFILSTVDLNYILLFLLAMALAVVRTCRFTAFCYPCGISTLFLYACLVPNMHHVHIIDCGSLNLTAVPGGIDTKVEKL